MLSIFPSAATAAKSPQSCPTLCDPIDGSPPGLPVPGILQARTWSGLPFPSPMHESEKWKWSTQSCPTPSDPMGCSLPGSSAHGTFQARVIEWAAISGSCWWTGKPGVLQSMGSQRAWHNCATELNWTFKLKLKLNKLDSVPVFYCFP